MRRFIPFFRFCRYAMLQPKVKKSVWAASLLLILNLLLLAFFWGPAAFQHHRLEKGIKDYRSAEREARKAEEEAQRYSFLIKRVKGLESKWETPVTQAGLIESLTRLCHQNRLKVVSQDFDVTVAKGGGQAFRQNLSLMGNYDSIRRFLGELESLPSLTVVEQTRLEREGGSQVRAVLQLDTFTQTPQKGA